MPTIRKAEISDLPAITEIYNEAVLHTTATFDTVTKTVEEQRAWYDNHDTQHPILVAEENDKVIGWASMSRYSDRLAYARTAEASVYVKEGHRGGGLGRLLSIAILKAGKEAGLHTVILRIAEDNEASIRLAKTLGYEHMGLMKEAGVKLGKLLGVVFMQLIYED